MSAALALVCSAPCSASSPTTTTLEAESLTLTSDGWIAEGNVVFSTPDGFIRADYAQLSSRTMSLRHATLETHRTIHAERATIDLDSGVIEGERLVVEPGMIRARQFKLEAAELTLLDVTLDDALRASSATRTDDAWRVSGARVLAGPVAVGWLGGDDYPDDRRRGGVLPPWLGFRGDEGLEGGVAGFAPLGSSLDGAIGAFGNQAGDLGVSARLRHVDGGLALVAPLRHSSRRPQLSVSGSGAASEPDLPVVRYDLDWASEQALGSELRLHPWLTDRRSSRLGAPRRTSVSLGTRTWGASADLGTTLWQAAGQPQVHRAEAAMGLGFDLGRWAHVDLGLAAARRGSAQGDVDAAVVDSEVRLPIRVGRLGRVRFDLGTTVETSSFESDGPEGRSLASVHRLHTGVSARMDAAIERPAPFRHRVELELAAFQALSDTTAGDAAGAPSVPIGFLVRPDQAASVRLGQRFGDGLRFDIGAFTAKVPGEPVLARAGVRTRWRFFYAETSAHIQPNLDYTLGTGARGAVGRLEWDAGLRRTTSDRVWNLRLGAPAPPQLLAEPARHARALGAAGRLGTPVWPGAPLRVSIDVFAPLANTDVGPELGGSLALGDRRGWTLQITGFRRQVPDTFDVLATASFAGF